VTHRAKMKGTFPEVASGGLPPEWVEDVRAWLRRGKGGTETHQGILAIDAVIEEWVLAPLGAREIQSDR
jgi:hypothetical protein